MWKPIQITLQNKTQNGSTNAEIMGAATTLVDSKLLFIRHLQSTNPKPRKAHRLIKSPNTADLDI